MKNNRGEISIKMIITVISLIIFGGICIFMLTGDNGLFIPKEYEVHEEKTNNVSNEIENTTNNTNANENGSITVPME